MQAQRQFQPSKLKGPWHSSRAEPPGPPRRVAGLADDGVHWAMTARANLACIQAVAGLTDDGVHRAMPFVALDGCFMAFRHRDTHASRDRDGCLLGSGVSWGLSWGQTDLEFLVEKF